MFQKSFIMFFGKPVAYEKNPHIFWSTNFIKIRVTTFLNWPGWLNPPELSLRGQVSTGRERVSHRSTWHCVVYRGHFQKWMFQKPSILHLLWNQDRKSLEKRRNACEAFSPRNGQFWQNKLAKLFALKQTYRARIQTRCTGWVMFNKST